MKFHKLVAGVLGALCVLAGACLARPQTKATPGAVQVHMVVTNQAFGDNGDVAALRPENVQVKQGKKVLKVDQLIPARGDNATLQLFILIDDTVDPRVGNNINDIRDFISGLPATTVVGVGYMSNTTLQVAQNLTPDHALAAKALRMPLGRLSGLDSPYLSLISLVKRWPQAKVRREVLMVSDGIDRFGSDWSMLSPASRIPSISPNVETASQVCQRYGVIVHSIYAVGGGRMGRNAWEAQNGETGIARVADETGGEYYGMGPLNAVSFKPYLEHFKKILDNQYYLLFEAFPGKKAGLQRVKISTQMANADLSAADNVWVSPK